MTAKSKVISWGIIPITSLGAVLFFIFTYFQPISVAKAAHNSLDKDVAALHDKIDIGKQYTNRTLQAIDKKLESIDVRLHTQGLQLQRIKTIITNGKE